MSTGVRVVAFVGGLAVLFGAAYGVGRLVDSDDSTSGYRLRASAEQTSSEDGTMISFSVRDGDDRAVRAFDTRHEKKLHLIAVRKDFGGYAHLHPSHDGNGGWSVEEALAPGEWRLFADFQPTGGSPQVEYDDIRVPGTSTPVPAATGQRFQDSFDGYDVTVTGQFAAGGDGLSFAVSKDGRPVTDLEPYLGAFGHLVAIRDRDLQFLHVHPGDAPAGPRIPFRVESPTAGRYHLYLDFKHDGVVRTASFVVDATTATVEKTDDMGGMDHGEH